MFILIGLAVLIVTSLAGTISNLILATSWGLAQYLAIIPFAIGCLIFFAMFKDPVVNLFKQPMANIFSGLKHAFACVATCSFICFLQVKCYILICSYYDSKILILLSGLYWIFLAPMLASTIMLGYFELFSTNKAKTKK